MKQQTQPVTILDFERYSNMDKVLRLIAERGYQSSRAVPDPVKREKARFIPSDTDSRSYWYNSRGKPITNVIRLLTRNPLTVEEILAVIPETKAWSLRRSLGYAQNHGFVEVVGQGKFVATGKHLTLKQE